MPIAAGIAAGTSTVGEGALELGGHEATDAGSPCRLYQGELLLTPDGRDEQVNSLQRILEFVSLVIVDNCELAVEVFLKLRVFLESCVARQ